MILSKRSILLISIDLLLKKLLLTTRRIARSRYVASLVIGSFNRPTDFSSVKNNAENVLPCAGLKHGWLSLVLRRRSEFIVSADCDCYGRRIVAVVAEASRESTVTVRRHAF